jgi:hypothetical protein
VPSSAARRFLVVLFRLVTSRYANDSAKLFVARSITVLACDSHAHPLQYSEALRFLFSHLDALCGSQRDAFLFLASLLASVSGSIRQEADARGTDDDCDPVLYEHEQVAANDDLLLVLELLVTQLNARLVAHSGDPLFADCVSQVFAQRDALLCDSAVWNREYSTLIASLFAGVG